MGGALSTLVGKNRSLRDARDSIVAQREEKVGEK